MLISYVEIGDEVNERKVKRKCDSSIFYIYILYKYIYIYIYGHELSKVTR